MVNLSCLSGVKKSLSDVKKSLSDVKKSLTNAAAKQLHNVSMYNFCIEEHFPDEASCINFSQVFGLCPDKQSQIQHCKGNVCHVFPDQTLTLGFQFRCLNEKQHCKEKCLTTISPLENTFFEGCSNPTMHDVFKIVMGFVSELTVKQVVEQAGISKSAILEWYALCREVCEVIVANEFEGKIGGEGMTVEVDESHLYRRKYGVGRKVNWENQCLLDCYCRETKKCRVVLAKDGGSSIMPLLLRFIDRKSTIVTDFAQIYQGCEKFGFHAHKSVSQKLWFVCPADKDVYTNNVKVTWNKPGVLSCNDENLVDRYLAESEYHRSYFSNRDLVPLSLEDKVLCFLYHIKLVYPGPGKVGLTFPTVDDDTSSEVSIGSSVQNVLDESPGEESVEVPSNKISATMSVLVSDDIVHRHLCETAKELCESFSCIGLPFQSRVQVDQLFNFNHSTFTDMLSLLRLSIPQTYDESSMRVDYGLLKELHPSFRKLFKTVATRAAGDCFYEAASLALFGDVIHMEVIRLCTASMIIRYHYVFEIVFKELYLEKVYSMMEPMDFITVGCATPSRLVECSLSSNKGRNWEKYSNDFCWANYITILAFSLACERPLYIYNSFRGSDGTWRHPNEMSLAELDKQSDIGGSVIVGHSSFENAQPLRFFLHHDHYSAVLPVVNTVNAQFKSSNVITIQHFTPDVAFQL